MFYACSCTRSRPAIINSFTQHNISMPDNARERILLNSQGEDIYPIASEAKTETTEEINEQSHIQKHMTMNSAKINH